MPELPEVEVLVRHLAPRLADKKIVDVTVRRAKVLLPTTPAELRKTLRGATFKELTRRGKYLLFALQQPGSPTDVRVLGHLGMTGRMYLQATHAPLPKHAAVVLDCGAERFVFEDTRYFGRFTLDTGPLAGLGPEPLGKEFRAAEFRTALRRSRQAIKVRLLDQSLVAGIGNIYASEALFRAGVSPRRAAGRLSQEQVGRLCRAIRQVLREAIANGSTVPLDYAGLDERDALFYFGRAAEAPANYEERLRVYDRAGQRCVRCGTPIRRVVQAARSTFYCPRCQTR